MNVRLWTGAINMDPLSDDKNSVDPHQLASDEAS